jgi:phospholipase/carboxylesterase
VVKDNSSILGLERLMTMLLDAVEINPQFPPVGSVIFLHGLGADGHDFVPAVSEFQLPQNLPLRFVFPHAPQIPVTINNGYVMPAWYDIRSLAIDNHADQSGIDLSVSRIQGLIQNEILRGIPAEKIILAGFSQGAVVALAAGLSYPEQLGGVLLLSGYLPQGESFFSKITSVNQKISIFWGHGTEDSVVPYALGQVAYHLLQKHHYLVQWHSYRMGHSVCAEEIADIANWLKGIY